MRLIDADALKEEFRFVHEAEIQIYGNASYGFVEQCANIVNDAQTIEAVNVVRCSECQYWQPPTYVEQEDGSTVGHCTAALNGQQTDAYWFCADGTR